MTSEVWKAVAKRPLLGAVLLLMTLAALGSAAIAVGQDAKSNLLPFRLVADLDLPKGTDCVNVYINDDWVAPRHVCLPGEGPRRFVFGAIPNELRTLRIDPGFTADIDIGIDALYLATAADFRPAPSAVIYRFDLADKSRWSVAGIRPAQTLQRIHSDTANPMLSTAPALDLPSLLPRSRTFALALDATLGTATALALIVVVALAIMVGRRSVVVAPLQSHYATLLLLAAFGWTTTVAAGFPGWFTWDELSSLSQVYGHGLTDVHPVVPILTIKGLFDFSAALGLPPLWQAASVLLIQSTLFWAAAALFAGLFANRWLARVLLLFLALSPVTLVHLGSIAKDNQMAEFLFIAAVCITFAQVRRSPLLLGLAIVPLFYGMVARSNGLFAGAPLCAFWALVACDMGAGRIAVVRRGHPRYRLTIAAVAVVLFVGMALTNRVITKKVAVDHTGSQVTALMPIVQDLIGISVRTGEVLIPRNLFITDADSKIEVVRTRYNLDNIWWDGLKVPSSDEFFWPVVRAWFGAVMTHPIAYVEHRIDALAHLLGFVAATNPFPYFNSFQIGVAPRRVGPDMYFSPRFDSLMAAAESPGELSEQVFNQFVRYFEWARPTLWFVAWVYLLIGVVAFVIPRRHGPLSDAATWLGISAAAYVAPYLVLSVSAQFRYLWWSVLATLVVMAIKLDGVWSGRGAMPADSRLA